MLEVLAALDMFITAAFLMEMVLRCVAVGLAFGPRAYLKSGWCRLDFAVVCVSVVTLGIGWSPSLSSLSSLRVRTSRTHDSS